MPSPIVYDLELSTGVAILSPDIENLIPIDIVLYGANLSQVSDVELDGGSDVEWVVTGVSTGPNSIGLSAFVYGNQGDGSLKIIIRDTVVFATEVGYVFPLFD